MKNVHLKVYLRKNLGDDLFLKIIKDRYPNTKFHTIATSHYKKLNNVKFYSRIYNKIITLINNDRVKLYSNLNKKCDLFINLGGSIFMEHNQSELELENELEKLYLKHNKPYYILGSNFGPYQNNFYREKYHYIFSKAKFVSFRDNYSYNLFSDLKSVRCYPDIVLSMNIDNIKIEDNNKVIISVINLENRESLKQYLESYENKIVEMCDYFDSINKEVILMSFCKQEGDEIAIKRILKKCNKNIKKYYYRGNIEEALNLLAHSSLIVGTRFHANILGLLFNKTIIPICYSNKTKDILADIKFNGLNIDIKNIQKFNINQFNEKNLNYKIDIEKEKKEAIKHFRELDKVLR